MLSKLVIKNFKLFQEKAEIPLSKINLFTGINGRGKSTVLQSFLLMKQSPEFDRTTDKIIFNGSYVQLGNIKDVKNIKSSPNDPIEFKFSYEFPDSAFDIIYEFNSVEDYSLDAHIDKIEIQNVKNSHNLQIYQEDNLIHAKKENIEFNFPFLYNLFLKAENINSDIYAIEKALNFSKIHYISADRIGPKVYYPKNSLNEFATVGALGQNTVNVFWHKRNELVFDNLCEDEKRNKTVFEQAEYWISEIFDGARLSLNEILGTNLLSLKISTSNTIDYFIPTNVGFGYSYILPIIISGLVAKSGEIIIVENPEAHIHPYAQSILSRFLTLVSLNDVQIFIESHSEHILNGLRIAVYDELITKDDLNVLYFDRNEDKYFTKINVEDDGGIKNWPSNFFDQATKDLNYLFGI